MRIILFCHSLLSDWNHGNAHFLRGVATDLLLRGHEVQVYEPRDAWSVENLLREAGADALTAYRSAYPGLSSIRYDAERLDLDAALDGADVVVVHEWNAHPLVEAIGRHRARGGRYALLFHDTHHRSVTEPHAMAGYDLEHYDGVLAFGEVIRQRYLARGWSRCAWTWHEAADTRVFAPCRATPMASRDFDGDLVWIGNWGDDERTAEIRSYLIAPVRELGLATLIHGVRYPEAAKQELAAAGIAYRGWLANYKAPAVFDRYRATVHIPRRPYVDALPGIPTIRVFEALACGIPLVSCRWDDVEGLFNPGTDYLVADSPDAMTRLLREVTRDASLAQSLADHGLETIRARHTCTHRVDQLLAIVEEIRTGTDAGVMSAGRRRAGTV